MKTRKTVTVRKKAVSRKKTSPGKTAKVRKAAARKDVAGNKKATAPGKAVDIRKTTVEKMVFRGKSRLRVIPLPPAPSTARPVRIKPEYLRGKNHKFRALLESLRVMVDKQVNYLSSGSLNKEKYDVPTDSGTDDFDRDFALSILSSEQDALFEIADALRRLKEHAYGACEICGRQISVTRLEAIPFARLCIQCQKSAEKNRPKYHEIGSTLPGGGQRIDSELSGV